MPTLLMTRPCDANTRFLNLLPSQFLQGISVLQSPLLEIVPTGGNVDLSGISSVIFSSGEAVRVASNQTEIRTKAYCVGERTTEFARSSGWDAEYAGHQADALVEQLAVWRPPGGILHLRGEFSRGDVAARLSALGLKCTDLVIYRQVFGPLNLRAQEAMNAGLPMFVPLFSPRTAAHFQSVCKDMSQLTLIAMSDAVVEAMPRLHCKAVHVSKAPAAQAMAEMLLDVAAPFVRVEAGRSED
ncbi:uroporphyrinogen-III synthase [Phaeobacter sp. B1627]|uniref:uroporphyrinogen-III synthase n=1 Tax=Phaeobacter sp. B1627 TaxID=2583809 RepID=UPI00111A0746|nr:uroporphyrinogen-III synthase [Phaeobacter sp. B1627]TNJ45493.1 uroporphyrinogen-III synthase [Phaeobacter sp. B1627]